MDVHGSPNSHIWEALLGIYLHIHMHTQRRHTPEKILQPEHAELHGIH